MYYLLNQPTETKLLEHEDTDVRQRLFSVDEFHYLNAPRVGIFTVYDHFECTFKCLNHPLCISVNLASESEGKLWCELLSSDKYSDPKEYKQNKSSHHYHLEVRTA